MAASVAEATLITLDITQRHLDHGIKEDCGACPIALAFKEAAPGAVDVRAGSRCITFRALGYVARYWVELPPTGCEFVQAFDHGSASPCTFDVAIPSYLANLPGFLADVGTEAEKAAWAGMPL